MSNNNGRARDGSGPGFTGVDGLVGELLRVARTGAELLRDAGVGCESPGVALRAKDQPGAAWGRCPECGADEEAGCYCGLVRPTGPVLLMSADAAGRPVRVLRFVGPGLGRVREQNVARLSAASDDAAELAEAFGLDVRLALAKRDREARVWRLARVAFRCAEECRRLRDLADAIQAEDALCEACGERPAEHAGRCLACAAGGGQ